MIFNKSQSKYTLKQYNEYNNPSFATVFQRALLNTCITTCFGCYMRNRMHSPNINTLKRFTSNMLSRVWLQMRFALVSGFLEHFVTTSNYSAVTNSRFLQFTIAQTNKSQHHVKLIRFLAGESGQDPFKCWQSNGFQVRSVSQSHIPTTHFKAFILGFKNCNVTVKVTGIRKPLLLSTISGT
jgi:hypothetical protein